MAKSADHYWDLETCGWVKHRPFEVPPQAVRVEPVEPASISASEEADVRSE
jgi:hypothetical protein